MIFSGVNLLLKARNTRGIRADYNKQVLCIKSEFLIFDYDFNMCKPLSVGGNLVLAFHDQGPSRLEDAVRFTTGSKVHIQHGSVPFGTRFSGLAV